MSKSVHKGWFPRSSVLSLMFGTSVAFVALLMLSRIDRILEAKAWWILPLLLSLFLGAYVLPLCMALMGMLASIQRRSPRELVVIIFTAYLASILNFAMIYYALIFTEDRNNEFRKLIYYRYYGKAFNAAEVRDAATREYDVFYHDARAFAGIDSKLWVGIDEIIARKHEHDYERNAMEWFVLAQNSRERDIVRQNEAERFNVALDCLHLSIITMTSVGYGDITPKTREAKLATDAQALCGQFLIVVAFGMALANWWNLKDREGEVPPVGLGLGVDPEASSGARERSHEVCPPTGAPRERPST